MQQLVTDGVRAWGRFAERPAAVNPLDDASGIPRALRALRLKEWVGWTLIHPELYSSMIVQDAHYLSSSEIYAYDAASGALAQHAATAGAGATKLPQALYGERFGFTRKGYALNYDFAAAANGRHRVRFDIAATAKAPAFAGELELDGATSSPPLSVSARLPGGAMYTHKRIFPAAGTFKAGDRVYKFDPARDFAILDEHKSFLPYRTRWVWGTFAAQTPAGIVGANFAERPSAPGAEEESCLWLPGAVEPLADISFTPETGDPLSPWRINSRDGRLDVVFTPRGRKDVRHQLGIFSIDYFQLYGAYSGTVRGAAGVHTVSDVHGVCESMRARL